MDHTDIIEKAIVRCMRCNEVLADATLACNEIHRSVLATDLNCFSEEKHAHFARVNNLSLANDILEMDSNQAAQKAEAIHHFHEETSLTLMQML